MACIRFRFDFFQRGITPEREITRTKKKNNVCQFNDLQIYIYIFIAVALQEKLAFLLQFISQWKTFNSHVVYAVPWGAAPSTLASNAFGTHRPIPWIRLDSRNWPKSSECQLRSLFTDFCVTLFTYRHDVKRGSSASIGNNNRYSHGIYR